MLLVTEDERKHIYEKLSAPIKDAHSQVRVVNINELAKEIQEKRRSEGASMVINVKTINFKKGKEYNKGFTNVKDSHFDCLYGIYVGVDQYKNILWSRIELSEDMRFNLDHIEDAKRWAVVRMHPSVEGSPFQSDPIFEVIDPTREAQKTKNRVNIVQRLFVMIEKMRGTELVETCRYLGMTLEKTVNAEIVKASLLDISMKNPIEIYNKLTLKTKSTEAKVRTAISLSILKDHPEKGIIFNDSVIGLNINDAVNKLLADKTLYENILIQIEEKDILAKNIEDQLKTNENKETDKIDM